MNLPLIASLDEILLQVETSPPQKVLFYGEGTGEISSYIAGWMAGKEIDVIVLDGANRFNPYMVSSFAKRVLIPPETLLKRIRIARAFTCYQMATLIEGRLVSLLKQEVGINQPQVIILGPITTFLDEDVPEREVRPLFERSLKKMEEMATGGSPFFLFQASAFSENFPFTKSGSHRPEHSAAEAMDAVVQSQTMPSDGHKRAAYGDSKRAYLMRRLFQFSNLIWKIHLDEGGPKMILEKGLTEKLQIADRKLQVEKSLLQQFRNE